MRAIKQALDPKNRLTPGKMIVSEEELTAQETYASDKDQKDRSLQNLVGAESSGDLAAHYVDGQDGSN